MGVLSNKIDRKQLKPGDHIYSWRQAFIYAHHGIYVGEGMVIHFTRGEGQKAGTSGVWDRFLPCSSASDSSITYDIGHQTRTDGVICSCLDCFLSGGGLYLFEYGVTPAFFLAKARGGTCTTAFSDPTEEVLRRAFFLLENGFGGYHVFKNNCENFAVYCKTGLLVVKTTTAGHSGQASSVVAVVSTLVVPAVGYVTNIYGVALVGCFLYCRDRYRYDIGVRSDVAKVPVEIIHEMAKED